MRRNRRIEARKEILSSGVRTTGQGSRRREPRWSAKAKPPLSLLGWLGRRRRRLVFLRGNSCGWIRSRAFWAGRHGTSHLLRGIRSTGVGSNRDVDGGGCWYVVALSHALYPLELVEGPGKPEGDPGFVALIVFYQLLNSFERHRSWNTWVEESALVQLVEIYENTRLRESADSAIPVRLKRQRYLLALCFCFTSNRCMYCGPSFL